MAVTSSDTIPVNDVLDVSAVVDAAERAMRILGRVRDRGDLHERDALERFLDVLLGQLAEAAVLKWLSGQGKKVEHISRTAVGSDPGYDITMQAATGSKVKISVKSSISACIYDIKRILDTFNVAITENEARKADVHVQVYYRLRLGGASRESGSGVASPRVVVPSLREAILVGWIRGEDVTSFASYNTESRQAAEMKLKDLHPMRDLLRL